jgi:hypothetical protein
MKGRRFISIAGVVVVAMVAAAISFRHQSSLAAHNGQPSPWAYIYPASIDGLIATTAALIATDRAGGHRPRTWAVFGFWLGVGVSIVTNWLATSGGMVAHGLSAFPAVAFLIAVEALSSKPRRGLDASSPHPVVAENTSQPDGPETGRRPSPRPSRKAPPAVTAASKVAAVQKRLPDATAVQIAAITGVSESTARRHMTPVPELDRHDPAIMRIPEFVQVNGKTLTAMEATK